MSNYYTPSGKVSPMAYVYFLVAALIIFPILALIYAYAIWYIPFPYINFFIAAGFGFGIGATVNFFVVRYGKVRSNGKALLFGLIGAILALYFHWAIWVDLVINIGETYGTDRIGIATSNIKMGQVVSLVTNPGALFSIIGEINEFGTWGIKGGTVSGIPLTIIWVIEAIIISIVAVITSSSIANQPFCEVNQKWFEETELPAFSLVDNWPIALAGLEAGNDNVFDGLTRSTDIKTQSHSVFTLYANETNENYLSIENKVSKINDKGEVEFDTTPLVENIEVSEALSNKLTAL